MNFLLILCEQKTAGLRTGCLLLYEKGKIGDFSIDLRIVSSVTGTLSGVPPFFDCIIPYRLLQDCYKKRPFSKNRKIFPEILSVCVYTYTYTQKAPAPSSGAGALLYSAFSISSSIT